MGILAWIIMGLIVGELIGSFLGLGPVRGFNLRNLLLATGGAFLLLILYRFIQDPERRAR
jgi:uncharacterized membrane protein YeaQ/YmgE (transglycosylase-associated protein family)